MTQKRLKQGLIQVYIGDGQNKTTCALGLALRAVGQGFKVFMVQFLKTEDTGEIQAARRLAPVAPAARRPPCPPWPTPITTPPSKCAKASW